MIKMNGNIKKFGFSLLELMLVLAIIGIILIRATMFYSSASSSSKANDAIDRVLALSTAANRYQMVNSTINGVTLDLLKKYLPSDFPEKSPWGGTYGASSSTNDEVLKITLGAIPSKDYNNLSAKFKDIPCKALSTTCAADSSCSFAICIGLGNVCPSSCSY